jgi:hypothetical protein
MSRLETESKMRNVVEAIANFSNVSVFVSLESGAMVFNNKDTDMSDGDACSRSFSSADQVRDAFTPYFEDGVFDAHVDENVTLDRWPKLYKYKHPGDDPGSRSARAQHIANVLSQMRHQQHCAYMIQKKENATGGRFDFVVKMRDNTYAVKPVRKQLLDIEKVHLKGCSSWDGVNDKVMSLPRKFLEATLGSTYSLMQKVMEGVGGQGALHNLSNSCNTERVVYETFLHNNVSFYEESISDTSHNLLPFIDARCHAVDDTPAWCVVSRCKDCWPKLPWTFTPSCFLSPDANHSDMIVPFNNKSAMNMTKHYLGMSACPYYPGRGNRADPGTCKKA